MPKSNSWTCGLLMALVQFPINANMAASASVDTPQVANQIIYKSSDFCNAILCGNSALTGTSHIKDMTVSTTAIAATTTPIASIRHRKALLQLAARLLIFLIEMYIKNIKYARHNVLSAKAMKRRRRSTSGIDVFARAIAKMPLRAVDIMINAIVMLPSTPQMVESSMTREGAVVLCAGQSRLPTQALNTDGISNSRLCCDCG